jgi:hypothetical protein
VGKYFAARHQANVRGIASGFIFPAGGMKIIALGGIFSHLFWSVQRPENVERPISWYATCAVGMLSRLPI